MPPAINCPFSSTEELQSTVQVRIWESMDTVPEAVLSWMREDGEIHLDPEYLHTLESAGMRGFQLYVAGFERHGTYIGFSVFQTVDMESDEPTGYLNIVPAWKLLFPKTHHTGSGIRARVLVGGDVFGTGVHLFRFCDGLSEKEQWSLLRDAGNLIAQKEKESLDFWLIKDFKEANGLLNDASKTANLTPVYSEPLMILYNDPSWENFEDYLASMKTKYRTKAKAAFKRSANLTSELIEPETMGQYCHDLLALYEQIWKKASFRPGKLNTQVLQNWCGMMGGKSRVKVWKLDGECVGFQLGFFSHDVLDAILVGFDDQKNREYSILERMLLEFVEWGIDAGVKEVRFGRTAGEIKSSIGAVPENAFGMVKHGKSGLNRIVKWIGPHMKPKAFPVRQPFKEEANKA